MPNEIIVEVECEILRDTNLGVYGLQEDLQNKIINTGKPVSEIVEDFRKKMGVLNDSDVYEYNIDEFICNLNNNDSNPYYLVLREPTEIKESAVNTLPPKSTTQNYIFVIGDHHPILASYKTVESTDALHKHLKMLVEQHDIQTINNLIKLNYGNSVDQLSSVFIPDQLLFAVYREQDFVEYTYQHQPYVFKIAAELKPEIHAIAESAVRVLTQAQENYREELKTCEKSFEQQMDDVPEIPYDQMAFVNHMHQKVDAYIEDMDDYHKVMNTLWKVFCTGGWSEADFGYLECVDRFREQYQPKVDMTKLNVGSKVLRLGGTILTVKNLMWVNPADLFNEKYSVVVHFEGQDEPQTYTSDGLHEWDNPYNYHNIVSIDGKAVI